MPARVCPQCWQELPSLRKVQILAVLNVLFFVATLVVNSRLGGKIGAVSRENEVILKLAGFAFSIWGIIYAWTGVFLVWQVVVAFRQCKRMDQPVDAGPDEQQHAQMGDRTGPQADLLSCSQRTLLDGVSVCFIMSCIFNMLWIVTWTTGTTGGVIASTFLLVSLAASLLIAHLRVGKFFWRACKVSSVGPAPQQAPPAYELLVLDAPLSIYLGWTCCASFLNITIALQKAIGWTWLAATGDNPAVTFAVMLLVVATLTFLLVALPPRRSRVLVVLPERVKQLFTPCQGNFAAGFVYFWATLALFIETEACSSDELEGVLDIPKACGIVGTTALITGILVALVSSTSLLLLIHCICVGWTESHTNQVVVTHVKSDGGF
mmetsp:Transcript_31783/g.61491  ORF Transcript_31783/g.61491 Transcript_31783/m.61491 type:complete len:378 (+) Transcript_31783:101-1234(+)